MLLVAMRASLLLVVLAVAHLAMAYRASRRERRRLLVYRIDVEADNVDKVQHDKAVVRRVLVDHAARTAPPPRRRWNRAANSG